MSKLIGAEINRIKKNYQESQGRRSNQLKGLGDELQGVQKIMYENIDAVLQRGELISGKFIYQYLKKLLVTRAPIRLVRIRHPIYLSNNQQPTVLL